MPRFPIAILSALVLLMGASGASAGPRSVVDGQTPPWTAATAASRSIGATSSG